MAFRPLFRPSVLYPRVLSNTLSPGIRSRFASTLVLDEVRDILPPKGQFRLYLFQHRIPLSYSTVVQSYAACWGTNDGELPAGVTGRDLVRLKNILESHRKRTGSVTRHALKLEANLIERAAELGDNTAIALLCGRTVLASPKPGLSEAEIKQDEEDKTHAMKLLNELSDDLNFPLAFKIKGDIAYKMGRQEKAEQLYQSCVDNLPEMGSKENDSNTATLRVECLRSIGFIRFNNYDVETARTYFELAVLEAENGLTGNPAQAMDCHYYLGQIAAESDKKRARYHLEQASRMGLKEAFAPLGFLLLNYFGKKDLAKEWFDLGASIGEQTAMIGQFDVAIMDNDIPQAAKSLNNIQKSVFGGTNTPQDGAEIQLTQQDKSTPEEIFDNIIKSRAEAVRKVEEYIQQHSSKITPKNMDDAAKQPPLPISSSDKSSNLSQNTSRWGF